MTHAPASTLPAESAGIPPKTARYWLLRLAALALLLASCGYFLFHLGDNLDQMPPVQWGWSAAWVIALATLGSLTSVPLIALHEGLADSSQPGYLAALAAVMLVALFAAVRVVNRLLPGLSRKLGCGQLLAEPRLLTAMSVAGLIAFRLWCSAAWWSCWLPSCFSTRKSTGWK